MKTIIVGGGITGLIAGVYALQSGIEVTIYESHSMAGGNSCGWKRNGFYFEGGMHWLVGSKPNTKLNQQWHEIGALRKNNPIVYRDPFITYLDMGQNICLYQDIKKLKNHLLSISPCDKKAIFRLARDIKAMKDIAMPIFDIRGVKVKRKSSISGRELFTYIKAGRTMQRLNKISIAEYLSEFKHDEIRALLNAVISSESFSASSLVFTLGGYAGKDSGQPIGGSSLFTSNILETFLSLGGVIEYNKNVDYVELKQQKAVGVWINEKLYEADAVIVTSDTRMAIDNMFNNQLNEDWMQIMREEICPVNCTFLSIGVNADLSNLPANFIIPFKTPLIYNGKSIETIGINNYAGFPGYAPEHTTALTSAIMGDTYDFWKQSKLDGTYNAKKLELGENLIKHIEEALPELKDKVIVWDLATPLTYERYCGTYRGSWMSVMLPNKTQNWFPAKSKTINNLYFAGQRLMVPGGLPSCLSTARTAVQHLCKDTNTIFQGKLEVK